MHIDAYTQEKNNGLATTDSTVDIGKKKKQQQHKNHSINIQI